MKKKVLAIMMATALMVVPVGATEISNGFYPHMGKVTEVIKNGNNYAITFSDGVGRTWSWIDLNGDWLVDDYVAVIMWDKGTPKYVYDDEVISAKYVGYAELFD